MAPPRVNLTELTAAVQSAVEQVLGKEGALGIDKIWIGFIAPDRVANEETAVKVANSLELERTTRLRSGNSGRRQAPKPRLKLTRSGRVFAVTSTK